MKWWCLLCDEYHDGKEKQMEEQMEQVWRSKDGKCTGSKEEVEAYLRSLSPLSGMRFPYSVSPQLNIVGADALYASAAETRRVTTLANLAPLIEEVHKAWPETWPNWKKHDKHWAPHHLKVIELLFAYEEALKEVPL